MLHEVYLVLATPKKWIVGIKFKLDFQSGDVETIFIDDNDFF